MSFADLLSLEQLVSYLEQNRHGAYLLLFLGAFFETLIPFSLAILGEVFFLSGALLAGIGALDLWTVMAVLYMGGILGDNTSYWMGRRYGETLFFRMSHWPLMGRLLHAENYQKGREFFRQRGAIAVFIARLSGPLSWVMPAMAGIFRLDYLTFLRFNTIGVILGISQFIIMGYFFGSHLDSILAWLDRFGIPMVMLCVGLILIVWRWFSGYGKQRVLEETE